jgi:photosystem II stability/assembly factor-like uncharacterized protein
LLNQGSDGNLKFDLVDLSAVDKSSLWAIATEWSLQAVRPTSLVGIERSLVLHSSDGGKSWEEQLVADDHFSRIHFSNGEVGWISGDQGMLLHTTDGGKSWARRLTSTRSPLMEMQFLNAQAGWVLGTEGRLIRTLNGGLTWSEHRIATKGDFLSLSFGDVLHGWVVGGNGAAYESTDGGVTWNSRGSDLLKLLAGWDINRIELRNVRFFGPRFGSISADVYVRNADARAVIFKTEDAGRTWLAIQVPEAGGLWTADFLTHGEAWVVTHAVTPLLRTLDGGITWKRLPRPKGTVRRVYFIDSSHGWFIDHTDDFSSQSLFRTSDAGSTWVQFDVRINKKTGRK